MPLGADRELTGVLRMDREISSRIDVGQSKCSKMYIVKFRCWVYGYSLEDSCNFLLAALHVLENFHNEMEKNLIKINIWKHVYLTVHKWYIDQEKGGQKEWRNMADSEGKDTQMKLHTLYSSDSAWGSQFSSSNANLASTHALGSQGAWA